MPDENARATVCLTLDFDATSLWFMFGTTGARNLSRGEFAVRDGAPRLLDLCREYGIQSTWYIPGHTADNYPQVTTRIAEDGHEIANHGYLHEDFATLSVADARRLIVKANDTLEHVTGQRPRGIRITGGDISGELLEFLPAEGFTYDSSLFGEYRPYWARHGDTIGDNGHITLGEPLNLVEVPITFITSDVVHFEISMGPDLPARLPNPRDVEQVWRDQFDYLYEYAQGGYFMLMLHPQSIGWGSRMLMLRRFLDYCLSQPGTRFVTVETVADEYRAASPQPSPLTIGGLSNDDA